MEEGEQLENVSEPARKQLNSRQALDYDDHRGDLIEWLKTEGKNPEKYEGYAEQGAENYAHRIDQFYRWVWQTCDGYTTKITHEQADAFVDELAKGAFTTQQDEEYSTTGKRKFVNAVEALFRWRAHTRDDVAWESPTEFKDKTHTPPDEFTKEERRELRDAVLDYDTIPAYNDLSPEERDRWKAYLAQKLEKPKSEVVPADWKEVNLSWKIPSLIYVTLDAGLRPIEVQRANASWLRLQKEELHIPKEESTKNRDHWKVTLGTKTVKTLKRWLEQRQNKTKYDDTDALWLNREGNRYNSASLNRLLDNLLEETDIDRTNRDLVWYSFRHSLGTHMADEGNLPQAKAQMRHKSLKSTLKYADPPKETVQDTLNRIG